MPVELKELVVKATVRPSEGTHIDMGDDRAEKLADQDRQEIIREAVETVLEILNEQHQR